MDIVFEKVVVKLDIEYYDTVQEQNAIWKRQDEEQIQRDFGSNS